MTNKKQSNFKKKSKPKVKINRAKSNSEQTKTLEKFRRMATVIKDSNDAITFQDLDGNFWLGTGAQN